MAKLDSSSHSTPKDQQPLLEAGSRGEYQTDKHDKRANSFVFFCTAVVALGPISFGFALGFTSPIQEAVIKSLDLTVSQFSLFGSLVNVGSMVGAIASGKVADFLGRKGAIITAAIPFIVGWFLTAICQGVYLLYFARLLVGFGTGMISFAVPVYIAESAPRELRGGLGTVNQLAVTIGITLAYLGGVFLSWRLLAAAGIIPLAGLLVGLIFIPESPRWLAQKPGRGEDLAASLQSLRGKDADITSEMNEIKAAIEESQSRTEAKLSDLGERRLRRPLVIGIGLQFLQQFSGINAIMFYASAVFQAAGIKNPNVASVGMGVLQVIMTGVAVTLMDKAGRRLLLLVSAGGMAVSSFLLGLAFYLQGVLEHPSKFDSFVGLLSLLSVLVYIFFFSLGMGAIPWIIMAEIFPAHVRGLAGSLATLANWFGAGTVTLFFNILLNWSSAGSFWVFAAECVATVVFVAALVPETRGRTLEEIEASFNEGEPPHVGGARKRKLSHKVDGLEL